MATSKLIEIYNWSKSEEIRLAKALNFQCTAEARVNSQTYTTISSAADIIHRNYTNNNFKSDISAVGGFIQLLAAYRAIPVQPSKQPIALISLETNWIGSEAEVPNWS